MTELPHQGIASQEVRGREHPYAHLPHDKHTNVCLAGALGYASRGGPKDRLDVEDRARVALADGITHCICGKAKSRTRARRGMARPSAPTALDGFLRKSQDC